MHSREWSDVVQLRLRLPHRLLDSPHQRHSSLSGFARDTRIQHVTPDSLAFPGRMVSLCHRVHDASCESKLVQSERTKGRGGRRGMCRCEFGEERKERKRKEVE